MFWAFIPWNRTRPRPHESFGPFGENLAANGLFILRSGLGVQYLAFLWQFQCIPFYKFPLIVVNVPPPFLTVRQEVGATTQWGMAGNFSWHLMEKVGHARCCSTVSLLLYGGHWINHALRSAGQHSAQNAPYLLHTPLAFLPNFPVSDCHAQKRLVHCCWRKMNPRPCLLMSCLPFLLL